MQIDELTLVLLGAFWTGTSAVFTGIQMADAARDRIVLGRSEGTDLPADYRRHILWYSWVPLRASLASVSALLGVIIVLLPRLASEGNAATQPMFASICLLSACVPFAGSLLFTVTTALEFRKMLAAIHGATRR
jgi:hypothetical protein